MKMEHITIHTIKLNDSIAFYQDIVGLKIQKDFRNTPGPSIVFLADKEGEPCIELIESTGILYSGTGISIGFHVDDVEAFQKELKEKGLNPTDIISPNPMVKFFFVQDPNGVTIQFL